MIDGTFPILPDEGLSGLRPALLERLRAAADETCEDGFGMVFDPGMQSLLLDGFSRVVADEGTIWLMDRTRKFLIPRYNSGPNADGFVGVYKQPLSKGMISMVIATEQPICENAVYRDKRQDKEVDTKMGQRTCAMIAVPLVFCREVRGVISCVQLRPQDSQDPDPPGFTVDHLIQIQLTTNLIGRLLEARLQAHCLGFAPIL